MTRLRAVVFLVGFALVAVLLVTVLGALAAVALFALILEAGLALTVRFVVFAEVRFAPERAVDRRKPFVRLLLICVNPKKAAQTPSSQPERCGAYHSFASKSISTTTCGRFKVPPRSASRPQMCQHRKTLDGHCLAMLQCVLT